MEGGDEPRTTRLGIGRKIAFAALVLLPVSALGLVATELLLRTLAPEYEYLVWAPGIEIVLHPKPSVMQGVNGESRFTTNSSGIRGDEFSADDDYRILALGGSTTECLYLDDSEAWPYLLQLRLNELQSDVKVWVGNIGRSGHSTQDHLLQLDLLVARYPSIDAVLLLVGANDLLLRLAHVQMLPESEEKRLLHAFTEFPLRGRNVFERTRIWRGIVRLTEGREARHQAAVQDRDGEIFTAWRFARQKAPKVDDLPDLSQALEEYQEKLRTLARIARGHGIRPIFITQPSLWRSDLPPSLERMLMMGGRGFPVANSYYSVAALTRALRAYNEATREVCAEEGLDCVDLASLLPQDASVFYDDFHFNEGGAEKVANALAEQLMRWPPFSKTVAAM